MKTRTTHREGHQQRNGKKDRAASAIQPSHLVLQAHLVANGVLAKGVDEEVDTAVGAGHVGGIGHLQAGPWMHVAWISARINHAYNSITAAILAPHSLIHA